MINTRKLMTRKQRERMDSSIHVSDLRPVETRRMTYTVTLPAWIWRYSRARNAAHGWRWLRTETTERIGWVTVYYDQDVPHMIVGGRRVR